MEVLLGLTPPVIAAFEQNYKVPHTHTHTKQTFLNDNYVLQSISEVERKDGFDDAVQDFEQTLKKSKKKYNNLPDVTAVSGE